MNANQLKICQIGRAHYQNFPFVFILLFYVVLLPNSGIFNRIQEIVITKSYPIYTRFNNSIILLTVMSTRRVEVSVFSRVGSLIIC